MKLTLKLHDQDNVAVARTALKPGVLLSELGGIEVLDEIPRFHKLAAQDIAAGEEIRKYNQVIGVALSAIRRGQHVHAHNCGMPELHLPRGASAHQQVEPSTMQTAQPQQFFQGYRRPSGKVGTRNYIGILTSVNCSATVAKQIEAHFSRGDFLSRHPYVDGVISLTHAAGCGRCGHRRGHDSRYRPTASGAGSRQ